MEIRALRTPAELEMAYPVIRELRGSLTFAQFVYLYEQARTHDGYEIVAVMQDNRCVAAMGYRILYDLVHGKHLYVDDLVVAKPYRSQGLGARLLRHAEEAAKEQACSLLRLCTGIQVHDAQRFYEKNGWHARAIDFKKPVVESNHP